MGPLGTQELVFIFILVFLLFVPGNGITTGLAVNSTTTSFGQLASNSAYRDLSNTNDPGGRREPRPRREYGPAASQ